MKPYTDAIVAAMRRRGYRLRMGRDADGRWARFVAPGTPTIYPRVYAATWDDAIHASASTAIAPELTRWIGG